MAAEDFNPDEVQKKMDEYHEFLLKNAAITFSIEGMSRDIKNFIQKKISFNRVCLTQLTKIIHSISKSDLKDVKMSFMKKTETIYKMFDHLYSEMKVTNTILNMVIQKSLEKEKILNDERPKEKEHR